MVFKCLNHVPSWVKSEANRVKLKKLTFYFIEIIIVLFLTIATLTNTNLFTVVKFLVKYRRIKSQKN